LTSHKLANGQGLEIKEHLGFGVGLVRELLVHLLLSVLTLFLYLLWMRSLYILEQGVEY